MKTKLLITIIIYFILAGYYFSLSNLFFHSEKVDSKFYVNEFKDEANIELPVYTNFFNFKDTIFYAGGEGEYDAYCYFSIDENNFHSIEKQLDTNKMFKKGKYSSFGFDDKVPILSSLPISDFETIYTKEVEGSSSTSIFLNRKKFVVLYCTTKY